MMNKKIISTLLIISLFVISLSTYSFAATDGMNNLKNTVMNAGNTVGNAVVGAKNAVVNGAKGVTNGTATLGKDTVNTAQNLGNDTKNTVGSTTGVLTNRNTNYTATRTATTNNNLFGLSSTAWTWLILGIVGLVIVGLVWYYGAQYEHKNYNND